MYEDECATCSRELYEDEGVLNKVNGDRFCSTECEKVYYTPQGW